MRLRILCLAIAAGHNPDLLSAIRAQQALRVVHAPFDIPIGKCAVVADPWDNTYVILDATRGTYVTDAEGNVVGHNEPGAAEPPA